jgi:hypothetical protein
MIDDRSPLNCAGQTKSRRLLSARWLSARKLPPPLASFARYLLACTLSLGLIGVILAACTPTPPVVKIGLVAPFEGIYRERGYEALAAMRAAIAEAETGGIQIMPLALDMGDDPEIARRTVAKLMADPTVRAVVGPLTPQTAAAVFPQMESRDVPWYLPFLPARRAAKFLVENDWAVEVITAVAQVAGQEGSSSLALAGWNPGWPQFSDAEWQRATGGYAIRVIESPAEVEAEEAVLWLGDAVEGAVFFAGLRAVHSGVSFWLATAGDGSTFLRLAMPELQRLNLGNEPGPLYWVTWLDEGFESWKATHDPDSPTAYAVFRSTEAAIAALTGAPLSPGSWSVEIFRLQADGSHHHLNFVPPRTGS